MKLYELKQLLQNEEEIQVYVGRDYYDIEDAPPSYNCGDDNIDDPDFVLKGGYLANVYLNERYANAEIEYMTIHNDGIVRVKIK